MIETAATVEWLTIFVVLLTGVCGMVTGVVIGREIGRFRKHRRENAELRQAEKEYRGLFESAHDAILLFDREAQTIIDANEQAAVLYGYGREELIGRSLLDLAVDADRARERAREHTTHRDICLAFQSQHRRCDGTVVDVEVKTSNLTYNGRPAP